MTEKVKLTKDNGEIIEVDLISYFELRSNRKQYMFFTRNEVVEEGYIKLYISEVTLEGLDYRLTKIMSEEDWTDIKGIMRKILTDQVSEEIKYLEVGEN